MRTNDTEFTLACRSYGQSIDDYKKAARSVTEVKSPLAVHGGDLVPNEEAQSGMAPVRGDAEQSLI